MKHFLLADTGTPKSVRECLESAERLKTRLLDAESQRRLYEKKLAKIIGRIDELDERMSGVQQAPAPLQASPEIVIRNEIDASTESKKTTESKNKNDCQYRTKNSNFGNRFCF